MSENILSETDVAAKILGNIKPVIIAARILGTVPYKYSGTGKVKLKPIRILYSASLIITFITTLLYIILTTELFTRNKKDISQITHMFNILFESLLVFCTIIFALFRSKGITFRIVNLIRCDKYLLKLGVDVSFKDTIKRVKIIFITHSLILLTIFIIDFMVCFIYNKENGINFIQWTFLVILFYYNRLGQIQSTSFIYLLKKRFVALNIEMKNLKPPDIYETNIRKENKKIKLNKYNLNITVKQRIRIMIEIHDILTTLCNQVNNFMSIRNLIHISINTVTITSHLYVITSMLIDNTYQWHIFVYSVY